MSKGIVSSVMASCLFAVMYFYTSLLKPLDGEEIFGWRTLLTLPCLTLFMLVSKDWKRVGELLGRVKRTPVLLLGMVGTSWLMGVQLWLFLWAPLHGRSLEVSMGYFLLPLAMVLTGRLVYGERLSRLQKVAVACAALGVGHELYQNGSFAWETLLVTIGYPIYFVLRRRCRTDHLGGLWCDMCLLLPWALYFVIQGPLSNADLQAHPGLYALIPILGAISASADRLRTGQPHVAIQPVRPAQLRRTRAAGGGGITAGRNHRPGSVVDLPANLGRSAGAGARRLQAPVASAPPFGVSRTWRTRRSSTASTVSIQPFQAN